jgi:P2 family phage contractile tail tube protein
MARKNEELEVDLNIFVGGFGMLGVATEFQPPSVELTGIESESSSAGKFELFYGAVENMEIEFTLGEHNTTIYDEMGRMNNATIVGKRSFSTGSLGGQTSVEYECRGQISSIEDSNAKRGEKAQNKIKMKSLWYYKKTINGKVVCEIDKKNSICKPDGKTDFLEAHRNFVNS